MDLSLQSTFHVFLTGHIPFLTSHSYVDGWGCSGKGFIVLPKDIFLTHILAQFCSRTHGKHQSAAALAAALPYTHYSLMKNILRHGSSLQPRSRPPWHLKEHCYDVRHATFFVSWFSAHSMPSSPFSLQVCELVPDWAKVSAVRPGIDLP